MIINLFHDVIHTTFSLFIGDIFTFFWNIITFIASLVLLIVLGTLELLFALIFYIGHLFYDLISSIWHFFSSIGHFLYHYWLVILAIIFNIIIVFYSPKVGGILGIVLTLVFHFSGNFLDDFISKSLDDSSISNVVDKPGDMIEVAKKVNDVRKDAKVGEEAKVGISLLKAAKSLKH